jgi:mRNA-degrading endonuclease RelE of RelBE toxin-antitoxin system
MKRMRVVALPEFLRRAKRLLSEADRAAFVDYIGSNPQLGKVIPGLMGVRKIRWGRGKSGKRGGVRIIYLYLVVKETVYLLTIYAKGQQQDLTPSDRKAILAVIEELQGE